MGYPVVNFVETGENINRIRREKIITKNSVYGRICVNE